jgi:hypothetical protein
MAMSSSVGLFTAWKPDVRRGGEARFFDAPVCHAEMSTAPSFSELSSGDPKSKAMIARLIWFRDVRGSFCNKVRIAVVYLAAEVRLIALSEVAWVR